MVKDNGELSATAYLVSQKDLIHNMEADPFGAFLTFQTKVWMIEAMTGLNFDNLRSHDPFEWSEVISLGILLKNL